MPVPMERLELESLMDEGVVEYLTGELAEKETVEVGDLREVLGDSASNISDEQLMGWYNDAVNKEEGDGEKAEDKSEEKAAEDTSAESEGKPEDTEGEPPAWDKPYQFVGSDNQPVADISKLTPQQLLESKLSFTVDGETKSLTLDEVVRQAQRSVLNERRINTTVQQRNVLDQQLREAQGAAERLKTDEKAWHRILSDQSGELFETAQQSFLKALGQEPSAPAAPAPATQVDELTMLRGQVFFNEAVAPKLNELAGVYTHPQHADNPNVQQHLRKELEQAVLTFAANEGAHLTTQRLQEILEYELPYLAESAGYVRRSRNEPKSKPTDGSPVKTPEQEEINRLKAELQQFKLDQAPDEGGGSTPSPSGGEPKFKGESYREMMELLQDPDSFKDI